MSCLICAKSSNYKLCNKCNKIYLFDNVNKFIRKRKRNIPFSNTQKEYVSELILYNNICKLFGKKNTFRKVHPLWAVSSKNVLLEYDIALPLCKLLIEYDGRQHFKYPNFYHKTKKEFLSQLARDRLKNKLAKKNGFKLIRFSYKDNIDIINIERKLKW